MRAIQPFLSARGEQSVGTDVKLKNARWLAKAAGAPAVETEIDPETPARDHTARAR